MLNGPSKSHLNSTQSRAWSRHG